MSSTDMSNIGDLPPIPEAGASGPQVCAVVRLYLAVVNDLPAEQVDALLAHVHTCPECAAEYRLLNSTTQVISGFAGHTNSAPSARVDAAVMAAIAARSKAPALEPVPAAARPLQPSSYSRKGIPHDKSGIPVPSTGRFLRKRASEGEGDGRHPQGAPHPPPAAPASTGIQSPFTKPPGVRIRRIAQVFAAAAVILLALFASAHILGNFGAPQAFVLPADLTWNGYVVYHSETKMSTSGEHYRVDTYHNLGTGRMHVETTLDGRLDVVAIVDARQVLGMDMMHHVAQWGANTWSLDDSQFDLAKLHSDLQTKRTVYLGKDQFNGQMVYRIRTSDGNILLLDSKYMPVNMLQGGSGMNSNKPVYDSFKLLRLSDVPGEMWDMSVPADFKMGTLPERP